MKNNLIIGSCAIKYWFPDFKREPKDLDIIGDDSPHTNLRVEFHDNPVFLKYCVDNELAARSFGKWEQIEKGFDDRDTRKTTYHFPEHDCYIKFSGYYSSYGDNDYTDWSEVRPVTKTVVVYE